MYTINYKLSLLNYCKAEQYGLNSLLPMYFRNPFLCELNVDFCYYYWIKIAA